LKNRDTLVSVIITTRNNEATLEACLKSIGEQTYDQIDLIVVDNNSTDKTKQIASRYTKSIYNKGPERSAQRNYGVSKSKGYYVLILDSDMELPPLVVSECVSSIRISCQAVIIPEMSFGEGFWAKCKALERSFYNGVDWIEAPRFFTKKIYQVADGYDEKIVGGEDWDLSNRVRKYTEVIHTSTPILHNEGRLTLKSIANKRLYYAKGFNDYYKKSKVASISPAKQVCSVYALFFSKPKKLLKQPAVGLGMLTMKTLEFGVLATNRYACVRNGKTYYG
jgi:glycosyltransferase involved in cell wall biosynthesis